MSEARRLGTVGAAAAQRIRVLAVEEEGKAARRTPVDGVMECQPNEAAGEVHICDEELWVYAGQRDARAEG
jgi:hypothetical protein